MDRISQGEGSGKRNEYEKGRVREEKVWIRRVWQEKGWIG